MTGLLGPDGKPISSSLKTVTRNFKRAAPPVIMGEAPGNWAGREHEYMSLPGGLVQFNLNSLTLQDFRTMRDHYQVNASQSVLTFMIHQADWNIECEDKKIADHCEENMHNIWTRLVRAMSQSYWAGYAPSSLEWDNDSNSKSLQLTKVKDLPPEECTVNWHTEIVNLPATTEETQGGSSSGRMTVKMPATSAKVKTFNGIRQVGWPRPIPVENSFWYPLVMENGNYYGKKLLRACYQSWFFSILMHLFANRYFERFGEPVPIGRAPYDNEVEVNGQMVKGNVMMETILTQLRNRSVVVLPNDRQSFGDTSQTHAEYEIEYLESQMRGADFERYLTRLDEEISLGLFTPLLILRTADVGSYNLGIGHMQMYLWMLNALLGDKKEYIDRYILGPMVDFNFSPNAPRAKIKFRKLGKENLETVRAVMDGLIKAGKIMPDLEELGQITGMTLEEIEVVTEPPADPNAPPAEKPSGTGPRRDAKRTGPRGTNQPRATGKKIAARLSDQVVKAFEKDTFGTDAFVPRMGYRRQFEQDLRETYGDEAASITSRLYGVMDTWIADIVTLGRPAFENPEAFVGKFESMLDTQISAIDA